MNRDEIAARLDTLFARLHDTVAAEDTVAHHYTVAYDAITAARSLLERADALAANLTWFLAAHGHSPSEGCEYCNRGHAAIAAYRGTR